MFLYFNRFLLRCFLLLLLFHLMDWTMGSERILRLYVFESQNYHKLIEKRNARTQIVAVVFLNKYVVVGHFLSVVSVAEFL